MKQQLVLCALVAIVGVVIAQDSPSAAASPTQYTPQDRVLAKQAYTNFACRVNELKVITENPGSDTPAVTADSVREAFESVATLEWSHVLQASFASSDARNGEKILGTPGGDMGEFIQALAAYAKVTGKTLSEDDILRIFERYLKVMSREKFSYETDEKSYLRLAVATGCRNLRVADMGGMKRKREAYLERIAEPDHIGDPFIRFLATNATSLEVSIDILQGALSAYHKVLWTSPSILSTKLCYVEVKGQMHQEQALIHVHSSPFCVDQGLAPMISPQLACPAPVLIHHPDFVRLFRRELVSVMTENASEARDVLAAYNTLAEANLDKYWGEFGAGLPIYTVEFSNSSPILSEDSASFQIY